MDPDNIDLNRLSLLTWVSGTPSSNDDSIMDADPMYQPGDIIFTCKPFVHLITDGNKGRICDLCLQPARNRPLRRCSDCDQLYFCNSCLSSQSPSVFKAVHLLECPILAKYGAILSNPSKLFLRLYYRLTEPESIPFQQYFDPLTKEEITFESIEPRIIFNSQEEFSDQITSFCKKTNLKVGQESPDDNNRKHISEIHLGKNVSVDDVAMLQFINLLTELSHCEDLVQDMISDDTRIYNLWLIFVRLWSHTQEVRDESTTGIFSVEPIAFALYLESSVIIKSHSCQPNCAFANYGPVLQLRAMQPIYPGQKLTANFVDISLSKKRRNKELYSYFISECFCNRCTRSNGENVDFKTFNSLKEEFVGMYEEICSNAQNTNANLSTLLNFSTKSTPANNYVKFCNDYIRAHELANELMPYYEQIYSFNHPEKSRFLFALLSVEMNLLLFKLELRCEESIHAKKNSTPTRLSEFSHKNSYLDQMTEDISQWKDLLKTTLKSVRWTHGVDHRLFREMPIPMSHVWRQALGNQSLTLSDLHSDPTILLRILCSNRQQRGFLFTHLENLSNQFKSFIGDQMEHSSLPRLVHGNKFSRALRILFRAVLVAFALLFPLVVYYTVYVEDF